MMNSTLTRRQMPAACGMLALLGSLSVAGTAAADEASDYAQIVARLTPQQCGVMLTRIDQALVRTDQGIRFAERRMREAGTSSANGATISSTTLTISEYRNAALTRNQLLDYRRRLLDLRRMIAARL